MCNCATVDIYNNHKVCISQCAKHTVNAMDIGTIQGVSIKLHSIVACAALAVFMKTINV